MKQAEPQLNITIIAGIFITVLAAFVIGYLVGVDHCESVQKVRTRKLVLPKPEPEMTPKIIRQIVYRYSNSICEQRKKAGL